jgi:hypothetical protein
MDLVNISPKQHPVLNRLSDTMDQAVAYAAAVMDNATDDGAPIPAELVASFQADYDRIILYLTQAASV